MRSRLGIRQEVLRVFRLAAALGGLLAAPASGAGAQIAVDELEVHVKLGRDSLGRAVAIRNETDTLQQVRITIKDWARDSLGTNVFGDLGTFPNSCASRITAFPLTLQIPPRATDFVRVSYASVGATDPGCWSIVIIEPVRPPINLAGAQATAQVTILSGVKVYVHPEAERAAGEISYADVESYRTVLPERSTDSVVVRDVVVRFENTGTAHLIVNSVVEIRDESTQLVHRLDGPRGYITPGAFRDFIVRLPELARGRYAAIVLLDYGDDEVHATQVDFEIP